MASPEVRKRFYVGNLPDVSEIELNKLFGKYGKVVQSEVKTKKDIDGKVANTFGFVTLKLSHEGKASEVIRECSNLKWKKHAIKVQVAQESFMDRLKRERIDPNNKTKEATDENYDPIAMMRDKLKGEGSSTSDTRATTDDHRIWYKSVVGDKAETSISSGGSNKGISRVPGVVDFCDNDEEQHPPASLSSSSSQHQMNNHQIKRRVYDSSSDDEDDEDQKSAHTPQRKTPKLQNSTSSVVGQKNFKGSGFLSKLESNSFWNDDDDADGEQPEDEQQSSTKPKQGSSWMKKDFAAKLSAPSSDKSPFSFTKAKEGGEEKSTSQTSGGSFSFLSKFGSSEHSSDLVEETVNQQSGEKRNVFHYEDSDEDETTSAVRPSHKSAPVAARERLLNRLAKPLSRDAKFGMQLKEKAATMATPAKTSDNDNRTQSEVASLSTELFFFAVNDERLGEGRKFLAGQKGQTADEIREKFEEQRPKLANILKKKMRSKAKKQELMSFSGGRSRSGKLGARKKARLSGKRQSGKASSATNKDKSESTNN